MSRTASGQAHAPENETAVPIFGSWRAIYTAVVAVMLVVMGLIALFSTWPY